RASAGRPVHEGSPVSTPDRPGTGPDEPREGEEPRPHPDIDAEFARLTEGLSLDEDPLTVEDVLDAPTADEEEGEPTIAVVATSVASATALAGAIRLGRGARTDGIAIPTRSSSHAPPSGAPAVGPLRQAAAHDPAAIAPTALQRSSIVLFWRRGHRMPATRYRNGVRGEDISRAMVLGAL